MFKLLQYFSRINHCPIQNSKVPSHSQAISKRSATLPFPVQKIHEENGKIRTGKKSAKLFSLYFHECQSAHPAQRPLYGQTADRNQWQVSPRSEPSNQVWCHFTSLNMKIRTHKQDIFFDFF